MTEQEKFWELWMKVKIRIREVWGNISDEDLDKTKGNLSDISRLILRKNDVPKRDVASKLVEVLHREGDLHP